MKLREGFVFHDLAGQHLVVAAGDTVDRFNGMIRNNETADLLFRLLRTDTTQEALVEALLADYAVDRARAEADVSALLDQLRGAGLLVEP